MSELKVYNPMISKDRHFWSYSFVFRDNNCTTNHNVSVELYTGGLLVVQVDNRVASTSSPPPIWRTVVARILYLLTLRKFRKTHKEFKKFTELTIS